VGIEEITMDHIFPISKAEFNLIYTLDDVQALCRKCNSSKGTRIIVSKNHFQEEGVVAVCVPSCAPLLVH